MSWEIVVGIETHAQLATRSKMFSGASTAFGAEPNTQASAVDIALPGVLPVPNRTAVEYAVRFGLAVGGSINRRSIFARKNYFYPDLPKGYQISQFELPIIKGGSVTVLSGDSAKVIRLTRAHLEEDAGKLIHGEALSGVVGLGVVGLMTVGTPLANETRDLSRLSAIDFNRAGTPLLEIVSEPDIRSPQEAVAYAKVLHTLVRWIGICDGNMQEGSFRCDANVSVRRAGDPNLGTRCEIKNLNSFRFLERAIAYEARRQVAVLEDGGSIEQETRLYDPERDETRPMRTKEDAHDYRYFPDPDLLPLVISDQHVERVKAQMPELPDAIRSRFAREYKLSLYDAGLLTSDRDVAIYFERARDLTFDLTRSLVGATHEVLMPGVAKLVANWVTGDIAARLNADGMEITACPVDPEKLAKLLARILDQTLNSKSAKEVFAAMWAGEGDADAIIEKRGLRQISDAGALEKLVDEVLAANAKQVADYRAGREKAFHSLVGQVMKATRGKANPAQVNEILRRKLAR